MLKVLCKGLCNVERWLPIGLRVAHQVEQFAVAHSPVSLKLVPPSLMFFGPKRTGDTSCGA